jgi:hypothetical protein
LYFAFGRSYPPKPRQCALNPNCRTHWTVGGQRHDVVHPGDDLAVRQVPNVGFEPDAAAACALLPFKWLNSAVSMMVSSEILSSLAVGAPP